MLLHQASKQASKHDPKKTPGAAAAAIV